MSVSLIYAEYPFEQPQFGVESLCKIMLKLIKEVPRPKQTFAILKKLQSEITVSTTIFL